MRLIAFVEKRFWAVLLAAAVAGLTLPGLMDTAAIVPYLRFFVMTMLFMVFLKVDIMDVLRQFKDVKLMVYVTASFLVLIPALFYVMIRPFNEELALAILILAAIPPGTAAPTLTDLIKGNTALAASITIVTSLLAPFSVPLVFGWLTGTSVKLNQWALFVSLATTMFAPLIASQLVRRFMKSVAVYLRPRASTVNIFVLFAMIYLIVASQRSFILERPLHTLGQALVVFLFFVLLHVIGYYMAPWLKKQDRLAVATTRAYNNLALAIVVAAGFFGPDVLLIVVLAELPWAILPGPFKAISARWL